jgi:ribonucleotide reductase beta subunit family protein with ferritin-like domain
LAPLAPDAPTEETRPMADPHDLLAHADAEEAAEVAALEGRASPFSALYAHWERNQWSALALDLETDRRSFEALDSSAQAGMVWIFAHRFHAEFSVARLLAPFLLAAPTYDVQLLLATQVADEHRHLQAVLRIYDEVFGVRGGIDAVRAVADRNIDLVAEALYERLEHHVGKLSASSGEDEFLAAVVVYHLLAEGVIARTAQNLAASQYERLWFPGLAEGQRLVARDEARHIGIGVSYVRRRMIQAPERTSEVITELIDELLGLWAELLGPADAELGDLVRSGYGIEPLDFYGEALRLVQIRLASVGYDAGLAD